MAKTDKTETKLAVVPDFNERTHIREPHRPRAVGFAARPQSYSGRRYAARLQPCEPMASDQVVCRADLYDRVIAAVRRAA